MQAMSATFSTQEEAELISLIEERRLLWDVKDRHYHRRDLKEVAYSEVCEALGGQFTVAQVRSRFANLRTQFMREKRKIKNRSGASPDDVYQPRWVHFQSLLFLSGTCSSHPSLSTLDTQEEAEEAERQCELWDLEPERLETSTELELDSSQRAPIQLAQESAAGTSSPKPSRPAKKRKNEDEDKEQRRLLLSSAVETLQRTQQRMTAIDECDAFGNMMAHAVRQIPEGPQRQLAMLHAHQVVVKLNLARLGTAVQLDVIEMPE